MLWSDKAGDTFDFSFVALIGERGLKMVWTISLPVISSETENTAYRLLIPHPHTYTTNLNLSLYLTRSHTHTSPSLSFNHSFSLSL